MATYRTPDVYVEEISVFPPSVANVGTAIPAFIGYTQTARRLVDGDLTLKPTKIYSLKDYEELFGFPNTDTFAVSLAADGQGGFAVASATPPTTSYLMHHAIRMYFDNGGAQCYVVSVGSYRTSGTLHEWDPSGATVYGLKDGLDAVALEDEPTLIVIPEMIKLDLTNYGSAAQAVLAQAGRLGDRFGIFDFHEGTNDLTSGSTGTLATGRAAYGTTNLKYGATYYPWVKTAINHYVPEAETNVQVTIGSATAVALATLKTTNTAAYNAAKAEIGGHFVVMPPSASVAGVYAATDAARGVWKAPANVSLADVVEPMVKLSNIKQDDLNIDTDGGKSINGIRQFAGKGTLVWGARTLAGNDNEWRYINVRRFFNMVEESVKKSTYWAVFEPNDANLWVKVRGMIENYLTDNWREGALAGATPKDAFFVKVGLGSTMTAQDILQGKMIVEIGMAVVRPAEFIVLKFSHKMQTS